MAPSPACLPTVSIVTAGAIRIYTYILYIIYSTSYSPYIIMDYFWFPSSAVTATTTWISILCTISNKKNVSGTTRSASGLP